MNFEEVQVRLCKKPDAVCLQGGCGYCSDGLEKDHAWKTPEQWLRYAEKAGMLKDWQYGYEHRWPNREKRVKT
jgi:hypothetical protein